MESARVLEELLGLADQAGIAVRSLAAGTAAPGEPAPTSAVCRVRGEVWVVLCATDPIERHVEVVAAALRDHAGDWLEGRWLAPALREVIER